jgi:hypothetical protein
MRFGIIARATSVHLAHIVGSICARLARRIAQSVELLRVHQYKRDAANTCGAESPFFERNPSKNANLRRRYFYFRSN